MTEQTEVTKGTSPTVSQSSLPPTVMIPYRIRRNAHTDVWREVIRLLRAGECIKEVCALTGKDGRVVTHTRLILTLIDDETKEETRR